jgi:hypothetical protein
LEASLGRGQLLSLGRANTDNGSGKVTRIRENLSEMQKLKE